MDNRLPMVNVTARILDQNGKAVAGARVSMRLTTSERYNGFVVPREIAQVTDANGKAVLRVFPNELGTEGSEYLVTIGYAGDCCAPCANRTGERYSTSSPGMMRHFYVVVPNADCNLSDITDLPPYEKRGSGQVITSEVAAYASQAANAADRAQNIVDTVGAIRTDLEAIAENAASSKQAAQAFAKQAEGHEQRARDLVDSVQDSITHFECAVTERTEQTANRLTASATACIKQAENTALLAIEARSSESLNELAIKGTEIQQGALAAIATSRENALVEIDQTRREVLQGLREEAALFGEDFEALTERAESAARRAGCSAASAANAATRACLCADRAEQAADRSENAKVEALEGLSQVQKLHACAHADATCAENAATAVHLDAGKAEAAATEAEKSSEMADCCAKKACKCADAAREIHEHIEADKDLVLEAVPKVVAAIEDKEGRLADLEEGQERIAAQIDGYERLVKEQADRAEDEADKAEDAARRAEATLTFVRGENTDFSWRLTSGAKAGCILELPATYKVGLNSMRLSWGGMLMFQNVQYREVGEVGDFSNRIELLCDISPNASMNVWIAGARVTGNLDAAEEKAARIMDSIAEAEAKGDAAVAGLEDTIRQITDGGDIQVERAKAEADRAKAQADKVGQLLTLTQGSNLEGTWLTEADTPKNTLLNLPVSYIAGRNALRLSWGGMNMFPGLHYEEIGEPDSISRHVKLLFDLPAGSQMNAWSIATGASADDMQQKMEKLQELLAKAEEAVRIAEEAKDKALAAAAAAVTGTISMVENTEKIEQSPDGYFVIGEDPEGA